MDQPRSYIESLLICIEEGDSKALEQYLKDAADDINLNEPCGSAEGNLLHFAAARAAHGCLRVLIITKRLDYAQRDRRKMTPADVAYVIADDIRAGRILTKLLVQQEFRKDSS